MLNAFWQTLIGFVGSFAVGLGLWVAWLRHRQQKDTAIHEAKQRELIERAAQQREAARKRYDQAKPIDPNKRTDFEDQ